MRLDRARTACVLVDVQSRLFPHIHGHEELETELVRLVRALRVLEVPSVVTEQYVRGLGPTLPSLVDALGDAYAPTEKMAFSCCGESAFHELLDAPDCRHAPLTGIETHVCVYQTALDLVARGYYVHLVSDAVGSRTSRNRDLAIRRMEGAGAIPTSVEMALFELLRVSGTDEFRAVSKLVK